MTDPNWFQAYWWFIVLVAIGIIAFIALAVDRGIKAHRRQVSAGREDLIGKTAEVKTAWPPRG